MIKTIFAFILAAHGLIHLLGAAKAFRLAEIPSITKEIPGWVGFL